MTNEMANLDLESRQAMHSLMEALVDPNVKPPIRLPLLFVKYITSDFSEDEKIGGGGFGTVYKGRLSDGKVVAVKRLKKVLPKDYKNLENELRCMVKATHGNIIRLLGYTLVVEKELVLGAGGVGEACREDANRELILCSEYAPNEDLSSYIKGNCRFHWSTTYPIIKGICEGVNYLHRQPEAIIHRDLKPANILLDRKMVPKITDFGLSRCFHEGQNDAYTKTTGGTLGYMAPESHDGFITKDSDMYSIGVIIMDLLVGHETCMSFVMNRVTGGCKAGRCKVKEVLKIWEQHFKKIEVNDELLSIKLVRDQVQACAEIAIECMDMDPSDKEECTCKAEAKKTMEPSSKGACKAEGRKTKEPSSKDIPPRSSPSNLESIGQLKIRESDSTETKQRQLKTGKSSSAKTKQRPSANDIIEKLKKVDETGNSNRPSSLSEDLNLTLSTEREVLDIHPAGVICFHLGPGTAGACVLSLTNNSPDHHVVFWIETPAGIEFRYITIPFFSECSYHGSVTVGPMSTEVVILRLNIRYKYITEECPPVDTGMVNILTVTMSAEVFPKCQEECGGEMPYSSSAAKRLQELGGKVHETLLTSVVSPVQVVHQKHEDPCSIFYGEIHAELCSTDVHPTKPWILTIRGTGVYIWNYETQELEWRYELGKKGGSVKFISRDQQWIVAGDSSGVISVMAYDTNVPVKKLKSGHKKGITSLAIHPEKTLLLSADEDGVINLHDWRANKMPGTWKNGCRVTQVKFNPKDGNTFVTIDYFGEIKIWDLLKEEMVHTFSFEEADITAVACHPTLPVIVLSATRADLPIILFCSSTDYRAHKMLQYPAWHPLFRYGEIYAFGFIGQTRLVIRYADRVEVLEIDMRTIAYQK